MRPSASASTEIRSLHPVGNNPHSGRDPAWQGGPGAPVGAGATADVVLVTVVAAGAVCPRVGSGTVGAGEGRASRRCQVVVATVVVYRCGCERANGVRNLLSVNRW